MGGSPADVARMKAEARARGVGERSVFSGQRPPSELPCLLRAGRRPRLAAGARARTRRSRSSRYLASGKPLVATRIPTHTQLLDDDLAELVEPTAAGIAAGIRAVLAAPGAAQRRAKRGQALVEREYGPRRYREKVARAYATVERLATRSP